MSLIRQYGNKIINLTKVISFVQKNNTITYVLPSTNYMAGSGFYMMDCADNKIKFNDEKEALNEMNSINDALNNYYKSK